MSENIDVSFILPSATRDRPPEKWANKAIDNINEIGKGSKYSYEILVVSEHPVEGENVTWIQDEMRSDGYVAAVNSAIPHANGKYHFTDNWLGYWVTLRFDETIVEVWNTTVHIPEGPEDPVYGVVGPSYNHNNDHDKAVFDSLVQRLHSGYPHYV